jgi:hypothetical protein
MRPYFLSLVLAGLAAAQGTPGAADIAGDVARVKAMRNVRTGKDILEKAAHYCDSAVPPDDACAEAYDWYGMVLQVDDNPETLRRVEPLYQRALELRQDNANKPGSMALSLELEARALVLIDPDYAARAQAMQARARELRAASVQALDARTVVLSSAPLSTATRHIRSVAAFCRQRSVTKSTLSTRKKPGLSNIPERSRS